MDTNLPASYFKNNRHKLIQLLVEKSLVVLDSNQPLYGNEDEILPFKQNNDFLYLTGIFQEESKLIIFKNNEANAECTLYLKTSTLEETIWQGEKVSFAKASTISGIGKVKPLSEFENDLSQYVYQSNCLYLNANEHPRSQTKNYHSQAFISKIKNAFPLHRLLRLAPLLASLRVIKTQEEIEQIKKSIAITRQGIKEIMPLLKEGVSEKVIEATLAYHFVKNSDKQTHNCFAFQPIVASGANSCILHYTENQRTLKKNDLLLLDVGASYGLFNADITRIFPIGKTFTPRQKEIYQALLQAQKAIIALLKPNILWEDYRKGSLAIMQNTLLSLGLITKKEDYKKYFMHGVSHFLGMGVHDVGDYQGKIQIGMVVTCEPGIYLKEEGLGFRIEDDILLTEDGNVNLSESILKEIAELESN